MDLYDIRNKVSQCRQVEAGIWTFINKDTKHFTNLLKEHSKLEGYIIELYREITTIDKEHDLFEHMNTDAGKTIVELLRGLKILLVQQYEDLLKLKEIMHRPQKSFFNDQELMQIRVILDGEKNGQWDSQTSQKIKQIEKTLESIILVAEDNFADALSKLDWRTILSISKKQKLTPSQIDELFDVFFSDHGFQNIIDMKSNEQIEQNMVWLIHDLKPSQECIDRAYVWLFFGLSAGKGTDHPGLNTDGSVFGAMDTETCKPSINCLEHQLIPKIKSLNLNKAKVGYHFINYMHSIYSGSVSVFDSRGVQLKKFSAGQEINSLLKDLFYATKD